MCSRSSGTSALPPDLSLVHPLHSSPACTASAGRTILSSRAVQLTQMQKRHDVHLSRSFIFICLHKHRARASNNDCGASFANCMLALIWQAPRLSLLCGSSSHGAARVPLCQQDALAVWQSLVHRKRVSETHAGGHDVAEATTPNQHLLQPARAGVQCRECCFEPPGAHGGLP